MAKDWQRGERQVAAICQKWWSAVEPDCVFCRTPRSGGWQHSKAPMFRAFGDVMVDNETHFWAFTVEVKRREGWKMRELLAGRASPVWEWWRDVQADAKRAGNEPMLWVRHNRRPWLVLVRRRLIEGIPGAAFPGVMWHPRVMRERNAGEPAVAYLGNRWVEQDPWLFRGFRGATPKGLAKGVTVS